jgi:hypothetical protein
LKIIAHRANLDGPLKAENSLPSILKCQYLNIDYEIDIWFIDGMFLLGHDRPQYPIKNTEILTSHLAWCHAKNREALENLLDINAHCFWHENDKYTLTSKNIIWAFPNNPCPNGIVVLQGKEKAPFQCLGVCTDYPMLFI